MRGRFGSHFRGGDGYPDGGKTTAGASYSGRATAKNFQPGKLCRQLTRESLLKLRLIGLTTGMIGSVSSAGAQCKVDLTVAVGPAPKNSSDRFEAWSISRMSQAMHTRVVSGSQTARELTSPD
jgi:hypothetical protein